MKAECPQSRFPLCIRGDGSDDLEPRKVYQVVPGRAAVREVRFYLDPAAGQPHIWNHDVDEAEV